MSKQLKHTIQKIIGISTIACTLPLAGTANASSMSEIENMEGELISAGSLMRADVSSDLGRYAGTVNKLVLSEDGSELEYIIYDGPHPWHGGQLEPGFITFENSDVELGETNLQVSYGSASDSMAPDEIKLTQDEAQSRLVSKIIDEPLNFSDGEKRRVEDVLFNAETGEVEYYIISMNPDAAFATLRRAVPANEVTIHDDGSVESELNLQNV